MKIRKAIENPKQDYFTRLAHIESGNNPLAKAKTSSAAGLYQFTKGTWEGLTKQLGLNYTLEDRFDPNKSKIVVQEFTKQNERYLKNKLGRKPNDAELYLAHFSGMGGANKLIQSLNENPNTDVRQVFKDNQIKANKSVFLNKDGSSKTVRDIYNWAAKKFNIFEIENSSNNKTQPSVIDREKREAVIDNTNISFKRIPDLATPPIQEVSIQEKFDNFLENKKEEKLYSNIFNQRPAEPSNQLDRLKILQEDLSHLYNYIDIDNYNNGGEKRANTNTRLTK